MTELTVTVEYDDVGPYLKCPVPECALSVLLRDDSDAACQDATTTLGLHLYLEHDISIGVLTRPFVRRS